MTYRDPSKLPVGVERHPQLWTALHDAHLPRGELPAYRDKLLSLLFSFYALKTVPTFREFEALTEELHALLRDAALPYASQVDPDRLETAARHLRRAYRIAERELAGSR